MLVGSLKNLGVIGDEIMTWDQHLALIFHSLKVVKSALRLFYFLKIFSNSNLLKAIFYALVDLSFQYFIQCWGRFYKYHINKL